VTGALITQRLNKHLAAAGFGSRRQCDELIRQGRVRVDGQVVCEPGTRIRSGQRVEVDRREVTPEKLVYWLLNKPKGYLCTNRDPAGRPRVLDLMLHVPQRLFTVGRLDEASEGLLLLTNDGELALRLTHPRYGVEKTYLVQVAGKPSREAIRHLTRGIYLAEGKARAKRVRRLGTRGESTILEVVLAEGKNREIRRMFAKLGHKVMHLRRVAMGPLHLGNLRKGKSRKLTLAEVARLRSVAGLPPLSPAGGNAEGKRSKPKQSSGRGLQKREI
jgi:23S rRNA pseudouridine2605 synthase